MLEGIEQGVIIFGYIMAVILGILGIIYIFYNWWIFWKDVIKHEHSPSVVPFFAGIFLQLQFIYSLTIRSEISFGLL